MTVRIEKDGAVWTVIHDRPEARNAMDPKSADELTAAFLAFDADRSASVAVFYGAGGSFCAGWDLKYASTLSDPHPLAELDIPLAGPRINGGEIPRGPLGPSRLELDKPVIAAIEGPAVAGGMELGLWCDFRVMAAESYFGVYCRRWGIPLIDGGTVRLPRIVGQGRALEIILTGRICASTSRQRAARGQRPRSLHMTSRAFRRSARARIGAPPSRATASACAMG
jgi:enoyl-CoA hydratase